MTKRIQLECLGDIVEVYIDEDGDVVFDGWDEEAEMAFIGFGDTERSPCWQIARIIDDDRLDEEFIEQVKAGNLSFATALIVAGADVNAKDTIYTNAGAPLLEWAAVRNKLYIIKFLLKEGANVNERHKYTGMTPLHAVSRYGYGAFSTSAELLIANGATVNAKDKDGRTPLHLAVLCDEDCSIIPSLLEYGANVHAIDNNERTPLHYAADHDNICVMGMLLDAGADVNARNNNGATPLHMTAVESLPETAELLIGNGANVNAKDNNGDTTLHGALLGNETNEIAELLLKNGADVNAKNNNGETPMDIIKEHADDVYGFWEEIEFLEKWGATR